MRIVGLFKLLDGVPCVVGTRRMESGDERVTVTVVLKDGDRLVVERPDLGTTGPR